ncbi:restriction endonuclease subunit S [Providencia alcalifaciens]|uniref:restriction endonuclease subunit S n=1 Tax=Providencia alcalifaciens TaxID=126385 RepID=UPI00029C077E|nr:restriction endonuclease subunit S [Providencia alcalifaciens]EKT65485.1 restriction modification system, specificity subunit [Providencia alcalifaciens Dmel2]
MSIKKNAPEIRIKKFSLAWQNKEIGSILAEIKRPVKLLDDEIYQLVTVKRRNEGIVPRAMLKGKNILVKNYYGIKAGDYLISKRQVVHGANGVVPECLDNAVVSNEYLVVTDSDEITAKFWSVISKRPEMYKLFFISSYGVDIEKLVFDVSDWKKRAITVPDVAEQNAITDHFQKLDSLINQHQQKHDKLSNIKKAMLEKMFPKQGETIPEIRFKGFSGEWLANSIGEICGSTFGGGTPSTSEESFWQGNIPWIQSSDIEDDDVSSVNAKKYITKVAVNKSATKLISGNSIAIVTRVGVGKLSLMKDTFATSQDFLSLSDLKIDAQFSAYAIWKRLQIEKEQVQGTSIKGITKEELLSIIINFPKSKLEQTAIGNYFQKLDALIKQHQQQITKLNNIKQACLSKMFV